MNPESLKNESKNDILLDVSEQTKDELLQIYTIINQRLESLNAYQHSKELMQLKRKLAKNIVKTYFEQRGYTVKYHRNYKLDFVVSNSNTTFEVIVKTKPAMLLHYATGYETKTHSFYTNYAKNGKKIFMIFVDDRMEMMYGNWFHELLKPFTDKTDKWLNFPHIQQFDKSSEGIFFSIRSMKKLKILTPLQLFYLNNASKPGTRLYPKQDQLVPGEPQRKESQMHTSIYYHEGGYMIESPNEKKWFKTKKEAANYREYVENQIEIDNNKESKKLF